MDIHEKKIKFEDISFVELLGSNDEYLKYIENKFHTIITVRGSNLLLKGSPEEIKILDNIFKELVYILKRTGTLTLNDVSTVVQLIDSGKEKSNFKQNESTDNLVYSGYKDLIRARNQKQLLYQQKVMENDLVFAIGPAGTGKTYMAVAMALAALRNNEVIKIILSRPAVEAGESLGYLPGDLREKLDPYLRPLTDALYEMVGSEKLKNMTDKNIIEIIPLAYMRGRTINNSFIILDEAQNATITQMKMFLTRLGVNSKAVVTGDITQIDLNDKNDCGLIHAKKILQNISNIEFVYFDNKDIVRHKLVAEIIKAYENN